MMFLEYVKDKIIDFIVKIYVNRKYIIAITIYLGSVLLTYHYFGIIAGDVSIFGYVALVIIYVVIKHDYDMWKGRREI